MSSHATSKSDSTQTSGPTTTSIVKTGGSAITTVAHTGTNRPIYKSNIPAPPPQVVLEEDEYIEALSKIIEPRTPRYDRVGLPNESWTPARLDGAQATPSWDVHEPPTPAFQSSAETPIPETPSQSNFKNDSGKEDDRDVIDTSLSLDQFQMRYTSEDNASFNEIIEKINAQKREKYKWLYAQEKKSMRLLGNGNSNQDQKLIMEAGESGRGSSSSSQALVHIGDNKNQDGPSKLEVALNDNRSGVISTWEYKAKNTLMFAPEGLGTVLDERSIRGNPKEIVHRNTGFQGQDLLVINQKAAAKFDPAP
ncbi:hypothetical protein FBU30_001594 [Linnemannia zychae]|nr:hypothetical protein FBU30_001594 [Linnemannia zychae]